MKKREKVFVKISSCFVVCLLLIMVIKEFIPYSVRSNEILYDFSPVKSEFLSDKITLYDENFFVYSTFSDTSSNEGKYEFIVTNMRQEGVFNNRYIAYECYSYDYKSLVSNKLKNVKNGTSFSRKIAKGKYANIYAGTVPENIKSVQIQGQKAEMIPQTYDFGGKKAKFYLYYCALEESEDYIDNAEVICTDKSGNKFKVQTVLLEDYPNITPIQY